MEDLDTHQDPPKLPEFKPRKYRIRWPSKPGEEVTVEVPVFYAPGKAVIVEVPLFDEGAPDADA